LAIYCWDRLEPRGGFKAWSTLQRRHLFSLAAGCQRLVIMSGKLGHAVTEEGLIIAGYGMRLAIR
jgi:hypothetical protein